MPSLLCAEINGPSLSCAEFAMCRVILKSATAHGVCVSGFNYTFV